MKYQKPGDHRLVGLAIFIFILCFHAASAQKYIAVLDAPGSGTSQIRIFSTQTGEQVDIIPTEGVPRITYNDENNSLIVVYEKKNDSKNSYETILLEYVPGQGIVKRRSRQERLPPTFGGGIVPSEGDFRLIDMHDGILWRNVRKKDQDGNALQAMDWSSGDILQDYKDKMSLQLIAIDGGKCITSNGRVFYSSKQKQVELKTKLDDPHTPISIGRDVYIPQRQGDVKFQVISFNGDNISTTIKDVRPEIAKTIPRNANFYSVSDKRLLVAFPDKNTYQGNLVNLAKEKIEKKVQFPQKLRYIRRRGNTLFALGRFQEKLYQYSSKLNLESTASLRVPIKDIVLDHHSREISEHPFISDASPHSNDTRMLRMGAYAKRVPANCSITSGRKNNLMYAVTKQSEKKNRSPKTVIKEYDPNRDYAHRSSKLVRKVEGAVLEQQKPKYQFGSRSMLYKKKILWVALKSENKRKLMAIKWPGGDVKNVVEELYVERITSVSNRTAVITNRKNRSSIYISPRDSTELQQVKLDTDGLIQGVVEGQEGVYVVMPDKAKVAFISTKNDTIQHRYTTSVEGKLKTLMKKNTDFILNLGQGKALFARAANNRLVGGVIVSLKNMSITREVTFPEPLDRLTRYQNKIYGYTRDNTKMVVFNNNFNLHSTKKLEWPFQGGAEVLGN